MPTRKNFQAANLLILLETPKCFCDFLTLIFVFLNYSWTKVTNLRLFFIEKHEFLRAKTRNPVNNLFFRGNLITSVAKMRVYP